MVVDRMGMFASYFLKLFLRMVFKNIKAILMFYLNNILVFLNAVLII